MKKIFTPFTRLSAGTLGTALAYEGRNKADVVGKPTGRYQGFKPEDRVFAPAETKGEYKRTQELLALTDPNDQLYINAHCLRGLDYVSTSVKCDGQKVTVDKLVAQLDAVGLQKATQCKIKLWVCEGGLDDGANESFAKRFSKKMFAEGYRSCKIFGYPLSLFREYKSVGSGQGDDGIHKRAVLPRDEDEWKKKMIAVIKEEGKKSNDFQKKMIWNKQLQWHSFVHKDFQEDAAAEAILKSETERKLFNVSLTPTPVPGARASSLRLEFSDGKIVRTFPPLTFEIEEVTL